MTEITLLVVTPGLLDTQHLESRSEPDTANYNFVVSNLTTSLVKLTNIQLYIIFDFTGLNLTMDGFTSSTVDNPLIKPVDDLIPAQVATVTLQIVANVGGHASPVQGYPFTVLAMYDTEPYPPMPEPANVSGGAQLFFVVPD